MNKGKIKLNCQNEKVIHGMLKEAIFLNRSVHLEQNKNRSENSITNVVYNESNSDDLHFIIDLAVLNKNEKFNFEQEQSINVSIKFEQYVVQANARLISSHERIIKIKLKNEIELTNHRKKSRATNYELGQTKTPIILQSSTKIFEGILSIKNYDEHGLGGVLIIHSEDDLEAGINIRGRIVFNGSMIPVDGLIVRATKINQIGEYSYYDIGIAKKASVKSSEYHNEERRLSTRHETTEGLELIYIPDAKKTFYFQLINVSVGGFKAKISQKLVPQILSLETEFQLKNSSMRARLISFDKNVYCFEWIYGTEQDWLLWLRRVTSAMSKDVANSVYETERLIQVFCESGALSAEHLVNNKHFSEDYRNTFESDTDNSFWLYRWINLDNEGKARGHISSIKLADNLWVVGDIVGAQEAEMKLPKTFVKDFSQHFSEFCLHQNPCPKQLTMWVKGHGYWKKYQDKLVNNQISSIIEKSSIGYTRVGPEKKEFNFDQVNELHIRPDNFKDILEIRKQLEKQKLLLIADSFDFHIDKFSSPGLNKSFNHVHKKFLRVYYRVEINGSNYIAIFTLFPTGNSLNRLVDSVWLFPLNNTKIGPQDWNSLKSWIRYKGLDLGINVSSIRRFYYSEKNEEHALEGEHAQMDCFLIHPRFWKEFLD